MPSNRTCTLQISCAKEHDSIVEWALGLWSSWMRRDDSELRALWYPSNSCGMQPGGRVTEDGWQDMEDECNSHVVTVTNTAIINLPPAMRVAIQHHCGTVRVMRIRNPEQMLSEAKARIFRALVANGCA